MQMERAEELRRNWGDKPCQHSILQKEYVLGAQTGDLICETCGKSFFSRDAAKKDWLKQNS